MDFSILCCFSFGLILFEFCLISLCIVVRVDMCNFTVILLRTCYLFYVAWLLYGYLYLFLSGHMKHEKRAEHFFVFAAEELCLT